MRSGCKSRETAKTGAKLRRTRDGQGASSVPASSFEPRPDAGIDAAAALARLLEGNRRFVAGLLEHPGQTPARRSEIANAQRPLAAVLSCADSRTSPEIVFDVGLGDIFAVRVAGNVVDHLVLESLDFAVNNLKTTLLIVMGHRRCGAVQAAIEAHDNPDVEIGPMLRELRTSVVAAKSMTGDLFENVMRQNVIRVARRLAAENRFAPLISVGKLIIVGAAYDLDTGIVTVIDRT